MGVYHSFEKIETATMFFLKRPYLVTNIFTQKQVDQHQKWHIAPSEPVGCKW